MKLTGALLTMSALLAVSGCGGDGSADAAAATETVTVTATPTATVTVTTIPDAPVTTPAPVQEPRLFPRGYPKVVPVSSLPFQVKANYEGTYTKAVAMAPGVWTPLSPGADMMDAATSGVADGFCGSIRTYERKYLGVESLGGSCW